MKNYKFPLVAVLCILLMCSVSCPDLLDIGIVPIREIEQEKTNWCWAASMEAILEMDGTTVTQCQEANWLWSRTDCCNPTTCNWGTSPEDQRDILDHWGLTSTLVYNSLTWNQLKGEIDAGRAISIGFAWCSGGGHSLVIYCFSEIDGTPVTRNVGYMDPWFGEGYNVAEYDWVVGGCPGNHDWYRTIYDIH